MKDNNKEANSNIAITLELIQLKFKATELLEEYKQLYTNDAFGNQRIEIANSIEELQWLSTVMQDAIELLEEYTDQDNWQSGDKVIRAINILRNAQK